jgi:SAM-dependent methyltransferase
VRPVGWRSLGQVMRPLVPRRHYLALWEARQRLRAQWYRGDRFHCPCCGGHFARFADYSGAHLRLREIVCPGCGALERHRLLWLYLLERTDLFTRPQRVLHVAPEVTYLRALRPAPHLHYVAIDLRAQIADARMDLQSIAFADRSFDAILCSHVLEHVRDDRRALRELFRVLRPGGWAILQSPVDHGIPTTLDDPAITSPRERELLYGQHDHRRLYGADYRTRLEDAGFRVEALGYAAELAPERIERLRLNPQELIYSCTRPDRTPAERVSPSKS